VFIVAVEGGGVGASIAEYFSKRGDRVVVIEKKRELCDRLVKSIGAVVYCGDVKFTRLLRDAEVEKADILFAVTGSDSVNLWEASATALYRGFSEAFLKASLATQPRGS
jgi:trk system potassium uptake protein TrkA